MLGLHSAVRLQRDLRPIMMTTMAALVGALPLALGRGTGMPEPAPRSPKRDEPPLEGAT